MYSTISALFFHVKNSSKQAWAIILKATKMPGMFTIYFDFWGLFVLQTEKSYLGVWCLNELSSSSVILYCMFFSLTPFSLCFSPAFPLLRLVWSWDCWLPAKHKQLLSQTSMEQKHTGVCESTCQSTNAESETTTIVGKWFEKFADVIAPDTWI